MSNTPAWVRITAILRPQRLDQVCDRLAELGVGGVTVTEVDGVGQQRGYSTLHSGVWYQSRSHPKVQIETVVEATHISSILALIRAEAATGEMGDGKIWIEPVVQFVSIRSESATAPG
jgi:nitrogen regulatory protein P-II 1